MKAGTLVLKCVLLTTILFTCFSCSEDFIIEDPPPNAAENDGMPETKSSSGFKFGVAGHAIGTPPYINTPYTEQMDMLKNMGMNIYRFSVIAKSDGSVTVPWRLEPFVEAARKAGVTLLPMLHHTTLDFSVSNTESYMRGKRLGKNFARHYRNIFDYYELGNELDNKCIIPGSAGKTPRSYNIKRFKTVAAYLNGMHDGVKSQDPTAKTVINASWLHYGFLKMIEDHGIDFDIIGYHWYSEMESLARKYPHYIWDISETLSDVFDKPIWFTEVNARPKDVYDMEARQHEFLTNFIAKVKSNPQVKALIIYELFDEPQKTNFLESNYGIVKWRDPYSSWVHKKAAKALADIN